MQSYTLYQRLDPNTVPPEDFIEQMARRQHVNLLEIAQWVEEQRTLHKQEKIIKRVLTRRENEKFAYTAEKIYNGMNSGKGVYTLERVNSIVRNIVDSMVSGLYTPV
jgi:hypothetical protein